MPPRHNDAAFIGPFHGYGSGKPRPPEERAGGAGVKMF